MKTIWKYKIPIQETFTLDIPEGAEFLTLQTQAGEPCMWWNVEQQAFCVPRRFVIYGTGFDLPEDPGLYRGTFQIAGGAFIWHLFEVRS